MKDVLARAQEDHDDMTRQEAGSLDVVDLVRIYAERTGLGSEDLELILGDLLTDLRHHAADKGVVWEQVERRSDIHFGSESDF